MEEKKREKIHKILSEEDAKALAKYLEAKRGNQKKMAEEIGKSEQIVTAWMKSKKFPKYCKPYLEKLKLIEKILE
jgi:hypothetical protein